MGLGWEGFMGCGVRGGLGGISPWLARGPLKAGFAASLFIIKRFSTINESIYLFENGLSNIYPFYLGFGEAFFRVPQGGTNFPQP